MRNLCNISSYKQVSQKGIICEDKNFFIKKKLKIKKKKKKKKKLFLDNSSNRYVCVPYIGNKPSFQFI